MRYYYVHKRSAGSGVGGFQQFKASCATCASHAQRATIQLCHEVLGIPISAKCDYTLIYN